MLFPPALGSPGGGRALPETQQDDPDRRRHYDNNQEWEKVRPDRRRLKQHDEPNDHRPYRDNQPSRD
jgi:hypothetical protein